MADNNSTDSSIASTLQVLSVIISLFSPSFLYIYLSIVEFTVSLIAICLPSAGTISVEDYVETYVSKPMHSTAMWTT